MQSPLASSTPAYLSSVVSTLGKTTEPNHIQLNL